MTGAVLPVAASAVSSPGYLSRTTWTFGTIWYADNTILYSEVYGDGIKRISADGGTPELLVKGVTDYKVIFMQFHLILTRLK